MKARLSTIVVVLALSLTSTGHTETVGCDVDQAVIDSICSQQLGAPVTVAEVVCVNDFQYTPAVIQQGVGDTVAWVNVEACGDTPAEDLIVNQAGIGCDPHHTVSTVPAVPGATGDTVDSGPICSPNPGVPGSAVTGPVPEACDTDETNVHCHTFGSAGVQHYSCFTNPGHTALMHGAIVVQ